MPPAKPPFKHWLSLSLAILAVIAFIACSPQQGGIVYEMMGGSGYGIGQATPPMSPTMGRANVQSNDMVGGLSAPSSMPDYYPYPYPGGNATAEDTREFLKQSYSATLRTRDVNELTQRVVTTVRGHEGRVDNTQSSEKYGYVQFVIPASQFDSFKEEVEGMVGSRFLKVEMSAQNLLPQKQGIEERQKTTQQRIADLEASRQTLVSSHTSTVNSLQSRINADQSELDSLSKEAQSTTDEVRLNQISVRVNVLSNDLSSLKSQLASENSSYINKRNSIDAQLKNASSTLSYVNKQDQNLLDNVAAVDGTISLQWISYWDIARLYLPGYWIPAILAILAILAFMWESGRFERFRRPL